MEFFWRIELNDLEFAIKLFKLRALLRRTLGYFGY